MGFSVGDHFLVASFEKLFASGLGISVPVGFDLLRRRVIEKADDVHRIVVADEHMNFAALSLRILFELHEKVESLSGFGTAIHHITHLHQMGFATNPTALLVDEAGLLEDRDQAVIGPVDVSNGHDSLDTVPFEGNGVFRLGLPCKGKCHHCSEGQ